MCLVAGQAIDGPLNGPAPPPWNILAQPGQMFHDHEKLFEVPHTASVKPCHNCAGSGFNQCWRCHGSTRVRSIIVFQPGIQLIPGHTLLLPELLSYGGELSSLTRLYCILSWQIPSVVHAIYLTFFNPLDGVSLLPWNWEEDDGPLSP